MNQFGKYWFQLLLCFKDTLVFNNPLCFSVQLDIWTKYYPAALTGSVKYLTLFTIHYSLIWYKIHLCLRGAITKKAAKVETFLEQGGRGSRADGGSRRLGQRPDFSRFFV